VGGGKGDGFGILKKHKTCGTNWPCDSILKPVWEVFEDFTPSGSGTDEEPPHYYDPYYHFDYSFNTNIVTGYVLDQDSVPIADAWIFAQTRLWNEPVPNADSLPHFDDHYTFSDDQGFFKIIPFDYDIRVPNYNTIEHIRMSAPGCSRLEESKWGPWGGVDSGQTYILDRFDFNFEESFDSLTIAANGSIVLQAWDNISLTNIEVQQNANFEARARTEVSVNQEFTASYGSETWIHTENTFYPCDSLGSFSKCPSRIFTDYEQFDNEVNKEFKLNFIPVKAIFDVRIYPNPGTGIFNFEIHDSSTLDEYSLTIFDQYGKRLYSTYILEKTSSIDLSCLSRGIYFLNVRTLDHQVSKKLIII